MSNIVPLAPTNRDASHYNMRHPKRGKALIFNHEFFEKAQRRKGTNYDCTALMDCLTNLEFDVKDFHNLTFTDIKKQLKAVSEIDHTDHDCLVVALLTHGSKDTLYACDVVYNTDIIFSYFTADKCKTLAGKPKMFFIQACRGSKLDYGYTLRERTESDGSRTFRIPCYADFLIAYSTIPGYYSWRIPTRGSWFILALCSELSASGRQLDLLTLLTFVCQRVAIEYETHDPNEPDLDDKKQVPCITSMLTRLVKF